MGRKKEKEGGGKAPFKELWRGKKKLWGSEGNHFSQRAGNRSLLRYFGVGEKRRVSYSLAGNKGT